MANVACAISPFDQLLPIGIFENRAETAVANCVPKGAVTATRLAVPLSEMSSMRNCVVLAALFRKRMRRLAVAGSPIG